MAARHGRALYLVGGTLVSRERRSELCWPSPLLLAGGSLHRCGHQISRTARAGTLSNRAGRTCPAWVGGVVGDTVSWPQSERVFLASCAAPARRTRAGRPLGECMHYTGAKDARARAEGSRAWRRSVSGQLPRQMRGCIMRLSSKLIMRSHAHLRIEVGSRACAQQLVLRESAPSLAHRALTPAKEQRWSNVSEATFLSRRGSASSDLPRLRPQQPPTSQQQQGPPASSSDRGPAAAPPRAGARRPPPLATRRRPRPARSPRARPRRPPPGTPRSGRRRGRWA